MINNCHVCHGTAAHERGGTEAEGGNGATRETLTAVVSVDVVQGGEQPDCVRMFVLQPRRRPTRLGFFSTCAY